MDNLTVSVFNYAKGLFNQINDPVNGVITTKTISMTGVLTNTLATDSTSKTTGSALFTGGIGVGKAIHAGSTITSDSNIIAIGGLVAKTHLLLTNSGTLGLTAYSTNAAASSAPKVLLDMSDTGGVSGLHILGNTVNSNYPLISFGLIGPSGKNIIGAQITGEITTNTTAGYEGMGLVFSTKPNTPINTAATVRMRISELGLTSIYGATTIYGETNISDSIFKITKSATVVSFINHYALDTTNAVYFKVGKDTTETGIIFRRYDTPADTTSIFSLDLRKSQFKFYSVYQSAESVLDYMSVYMNSDLTVSQTTNSQRIFGIFSQQESVNNSNEGCIFAAYNAYDDDSDGNTDPVSLITITPASLVLGKTGSETTINGTLQMTGGFDRGFGMVKELWLSHVYNSGLDTNISFPINDTSFTKVIGWDVFFRPNASTAGVYTKAPGIEESSSAGYLCTTYTFSSSVHFVPTYLSAQAKPANGETIYCHIWYI